MSEERPEIGVVGCGAITEYYYAPSLGAIEHRGLARVTALFDPSAERLEKVGALFPKAKRVTDFDALMAAKPALAIVASPATFHAGQTVALLKSGASVLCEKPMASTTAEAGAMINAAAEAKRKLAIGLFRRFFPAALTIRDFLRNETLGRPVRFDFSEGGAFNWPAQSASFFQRKTAQGGVFLDVGVHALDLALWWFGEPSAVEHEDDAMGGLEINSVTRLQFENGVSGRLQLSRDWELPNRYVIQCERGWMAWKVGEANQLELGGTNGAVSVKGEIRTCERTAPSYQESFVAQILNCLHSIMDGEPLAVPGEEGIRSMRLIEQCYRERKLLSMPWLGDDERERAQALAVA